jgi:hypothetical protein
MGLQGADFGETIIDRVPAVDCDTLHPNDSRCLWGAGLGEGAFMSWIRRQNPIVGVAAVLGIMAVSSFVVVGGTLKAVEAFRGDAPLDGARPRRRRRRRRARR